VGWPRAREAALRWPLTSAGPCSNGAILGISPPVKRRWVRASSLRFGVRAFRRHAVVALAHQPVSDPERQGDGRQRQQLLGGGHLQVEDDELARQRQQGDQQDDLGLDDALLAGDDVLQGVVERQRDQLMS